MLETHGFELPRSLDELLAPSRTALLVYDMQAGIVNQVKNGAAIAQKVRTVLDAARHAGIRTFFTRHMSLPTNLMGAFQYRMAMAWQRTEDPSKVQSWFLRDTPPFHIVRELQPTAEEAIFDKLAMSAFEGTPLAFALRDCGIRSLMVAGIALEIGIDPTCRHAADLGIIPILIRDACGAGNPQIAEQSVSTLAHMGDTIVTDLSTISEHLAAIEDPRR